MNVYRITGKCYQIWYQKGNLPIHLYHQVTSYRYFIVDSCIHSLNLKCIIQLKQFYNIATKVSSTKKWYYFWWFTWLLNSTMIKAVVMSKRCHRNMDPCSYEIYAHGEMPPSISSIIRAFFLKITHLSTCYHESHLKYICKSERIASLSFRPSCSQFVRQNRKPQTGILNWSHCRYSFGPFY